MIVWVVVCDVGGVRVFGVDGVYNVAADCRRVGCRGRVSRVVLQIWLYCRFFTIHDQNANITDVRVGCLSC